MSKLQRGIQVAVCEDDDDLRDILVCSLPHFGLQTFGTGSAEALEPMLEGRAIDVVILDIGLPGEDGFSLARRLRMERPQLGIVMLTARTLVEDRVRGLNQGADLYFAKPVDLRELAAAISSLCRRLAWTRPGATSAWLFNRNRESLTTPDGRVLELTTMESRLLDRLLARPGETVPRADLYELLGWPCDEKASHRLDTLISRLRSKAAQATRDHVLPLRARHGVGYAFLTDPASTR